MPVRSSILCGFVASCEPNHTAPDCIISRETTKRAKPWLPCLTPTDHLAFHPNPAILHPMNSLSPIVSEFETLEQAEAYEAWLRAKVSASLSDGKPTIAHDAAMAQVRSIIEEKRAAETRLAR
jgi:hypothetical protein